MEKRIFVELIVDEEELMAQETTVEKELGWLNQSGIQANVIDGVSVLFAEAEGNDPLIELYADDQTAKDRLKELYKENFPEGTDSEGNEVVLDGDLYDSCEALGYVEKMDIKTDLDFKAKRIFIRNDVQLEVNYPSSTYEYTIYAIYDEIQEDGYADVVTEKIGTEVLPWKRTEELGGLSGVMSYLTKKYNLKNLKN